MKSLMAGTAAAIFASIIAMATPAKTAEISIMTGGAPREAFKLLTPQFEKQTGHKVTFIYVVTASMLLLFQEPASSQTFPDLGIPQ
jgi:molybdate transport system substrate-binding protein